MDGIERFSAELRVGMRTNVCFMNGINSRLHRFMDVELWVATNRYLVVKVFLPLRQNISKLIRRLIIMYL